MSSKILLSSLCSITFSSLGYAVVDFCAFEDDTALHTITLDKLQSKDAKKHIENYPHAKVLRMRCPMCPSGEGDGTNYSKKNKVVICKLHQLTEHSKIST